ncbi:ABC-2 family transporter protein [Dehalogenimonas alkenigignens]|uniref:ABC-2 family transporter protein n=1 Tax=Dehalogenimonas alkenigignens TaxID=1217799 RepID=A0A0W0GKX3_9CHLR|nr:ABC transporter permease [Dehalogenimonas alkenigignens]KTB49211.1 ABC-2 family transporter protein [Dehalogenimonas alkenigignens]
MKLNRVGILVRNEVLHGPKDVMLVIAVVFPILAALFINLAFGNIFTDKAKLGVYDQGNSRVVPVLESSDTIIYKSFSSELALRAAAADGSIDMGIVLPGDFDTVLGTGTVSLKAFIWGESQAKNRALIPIALADAVRAAAGSELPVTIDTVALGDEASLPWSDRLLPLIVLMGVFYSGLMIPSSALINEKQHRTLEALYVTPATLGDIFLSKGVIAVALATIMGVLTLVLSGSFNGPAPLIVLVLFLGAMMATEIGLLTGAWVSDMNSLFAVLKAGGILLFGPAIVFMFPQIPSWVGYVFPTYYVIRPVVDLAVNGASFGDVAVFIGVLAAIVALGGLAVASVVRRLSTQALRLNA